MPGPTISETPPWPWPCSIGSSTGPSSSRSRAPPTVPTAREPAPPPNHASHTATVFVDQFSPPKWTSPKPAATRGIAMRVRSTEDGMGPGPLAVGQIVENVPGLVNLTALDARGAPEGVVDRTAERFRAVENHQQRPVGA